MEHETKEEYSVVDIPRESMNPTNQPVSFYGDNSRNTDGALLAALASKDYYAPALDGVSANGIGCVRAEVGDTKMIVKDAAANIRSDVRQEGQEAVGATKDAECRIMQKLGDLEARTMVKLGDVECKVIKENSDQTLYLTNQLSVIREQGIRNEYETKLSREQAIKEINIKVDHEAERTNDKIAHFAEKQIELLQEIKCCSCGPVGLSLGRCGVSAVK